MVFICDCSSLYYDYVMPYFHHQSGGGVCGLGGSRWENTSDALQCRYCPAVDGTTSNTSLQSVLCSTLNIHNFSNTTTVCMVSSPDPPFLFGGGSGNETTVCSAVDFLFHSNVYIYYFFSSPISSPAIVAFGTSSATCSANNETCGERLVMGLLNQWKPRDCEDTLSLN